MFAQRITQRTGLTARRAALVTGVVAALALTAPGAQASAAAPAVSSAPPASLQAAHLSSAKHSAARADVAVGPTLIGDVFNGATTIVTSGTPAGATAVTSG